MTDFTVYARVSTSKQEHGIDAQRATAQRYASSVGGKIIAEFSEKETGKNDHRTELARAIAHCKDHGSTLLIAKLDRLSRNAGFLHNLVEDLKVAGVEIIAADSPGLIGNTMMLAVMSGVAQHEREITSKRTIDGLAAARAKGVKLGRPKGIPVSNETRSRIAAGVKKAASVPDPMTLAVARKAWGAGVEYPDIARELNDLGAKAPRGGKFSATQVKRMLDRAESP